MYYKLKVLIRDYADDSNGNIAIMFGLMATVFLMCSAVAVDITSVLKMKKDIQGAADIAALAAVIHGNKDDTSKRHAISMLFENWSGDPKLINDVDVRFENDHSAEVTVRSTYVTQFLHIIGFPTLSPSAVSVASPYTSGSEMMCVHALDQYESGTLILNSKPRSSDIFSGASLYSNYCSTQVDSSSTASVSLKAGSYSSGTNCFAGSSAPIENVFPNPEANCDALGDVFKNRPTPPASFCDYTDAELEGSVRSDNVTVSPGNYCNGLSVDGDDVKFEPGVYRITNGPLEISAEKISVKKNKKKNKSSDDGVTFIVTGTEASVQIDAESIDLKASSTGDAPAFIFFVRGDPGEDEDSNIKVKQFMRFEGILYFPQQHLQMRWSRPEEGSKYWDKKPSPFTSVIANTIDFHGYSQWGFEYDPTATSLPIPSELRRDKYSPRLVR